jgi:hypothetical protein
MTLARDLKLGRVDERDVETSLEKLGVLTMD